MENTAEVPRLVEIENLQQSAEPLPEERQVNRGETGWYHQREFCAFFALHL